MSIIKTNLKFAFYYFKAFIKWIIISSIVGISGGAIGSVFHILIDEATVLRTQKGFLLYLLPLGGIVITAMYHLFSKKGKIDTNRVIDSVRKDEKIPLVMMPLIFISTIITHLFGGSAGREGAAIQLGGSLGYNAGKLLRLNEEDMHIIVMAGMAAVFSALFGTPLAAAVFALEVVTVGIIHYAAIVPCIISAVTARIIAGLFGISAFGFKGIETCDVTAKTLVAVTLLALLCAFVSILFCISIKRCEKIADRLFKNSYLRAFVGGVIIVFLSLLLGTRDYNGAGVDVIARAMEGDANVEAFLLKILFTAITISAGFKGGEIVPAFFIGSTFGCVVGPLLGLDAPFSAAIGFIALFCGVVNCPIASIILSVEVFGADGIIFFALASAISYMMSGCSGLYHSQKIVYSKFDDKYIDMNTK